MGGLKENSMKNWFNWAILTVANYFVQFFFELLELQPSKEVFKNMVHELETGRENPDGADQGFIGSFFPDLLDQPLFHAPLNGTKLDGTYRLPLGYQMDASYYCK